MEKDKGTIYIVGISGGKDSDAALLYMVKESGIPHEQIHPTFCDTGNEPQETYDHVAWLNDNVFPVMGITPEMDFYELAAHKGRFSSAKARFCTVELKIKPNMAYAEWLQMQGYHVVLVSGVRAGESPERAKLPEREFNEEYDCDMWRPLLRWSLADVWAIHDKYNVPRNPLYDMGMRRVGCLPCIMSRKEEMYLISQLFPERIDRIRKAETEVGATCSFFASDSIPLRYRTSRTYQRKDTEGIVNEEYFDGSAEEVEPSEGKLLDVAPLKKKRKKFNRFAVTMIDDVIRWATAEYSASTGLLDFESDLPASCSDGWGMCE